MVLFIPGMGKVAMDLAIRELESEELELVVGGDSQHGSSMCTTLDRIFRIGPVKVLVIEESCDSL
jgi:hypothetical protein